MRFLGWVCCSVTVSVLCSPEIITALVDLGTFSAFNQSSVEVLPSLKWDFHPGNWERLSFPLGGTGKCQISLLLVLSMSIPAAPSGQAEQGEGPSCSGSAEVAFTAQDNPGICLLSRQNL